MSDNFKFKGHPETALSDYKLRLTGDKQNGSPREPQMEFAVVENQPRLKVYTNIPNDKDDGRLSANLDAPTFFAILQLVERAFDLEPGQKYSVENKGFTYFGGKKSDAPSVISTTLVGRDDDGKIYIAVVNNRVTPVRFYFRPTNWHCLVGPDGTPIPEKEVTEIFAKSYLKLLYNLVPNVMDTNYVKRNETARAKRRQQQQGQGGGNGGGWNRGGDNNSNSGGWKKQESRPSPAPAPAPAPAASTGSFDDDWPTDVTNDIPM